MMDSTATLVTAATGVIAIGGGLVLHVIRYAYQQGRTDQRLSTVEDAIDGVPAALTALTAGAAAMTAGMSAMQHTTDRLDKSIDRLEARVGRV